MLLSHVQRFNNLWNIFHVKKLFQRYVSTYNSIKQNENSISFYFHKIFYTARKILLFCFQKYRSFLLHHIALGVTAHGNWGRKGKKGKEFILNEEEVEGYRIKEEQKRRGKSVLYDKSLKKWSTLLLTDVYIWASGIQIQNKIQ